MDPDPELTLLPLPNAREPPCPALLPKAAPATKNTPPPASPALDVVSPADTTIWPPAPDCPLPTATLIDPPDPPVAEPDTIDSQPELPDEDSPLASDSEPDTPAERAGAV